MINGFLEKVPEHKPIPGTIKFFIAPHAGYIYSGQTAAYDYRLIKGNHYDSVIIIGPYHSALFHGASIWKSGLWQTPLGDVAIDEELAQAIANENPDFQFTENAHLAEHSLEAQVPFLQKVLTNFKIVPILISDPSPDNYKALAQAVYKNIQGKSVLVIASSDMSHYYEDSIARTMDSTTLGFLKDQNAVGLSTALNAGKGELCGQAAVLTLLEISHLMGNTHLEVLNYSTTADTTGDRSRVVGYGASVIYQDSAPQASVKTEKVQAKSLTPEEKHELLKIARNTVENFVENGNIYQPSENDPVFKEDRAAFVTIMEKGRLRGCIGSLTAREPLAVAVRNMAIQAASEDPRFQPVQKEELKDLEFEVSVLSAPVKIKSADEIILGKHGVIVNQAGHSGVFLPKVGEEFDFDKTKFLNELCSQKAGLPDSCWQDPATDLYIFTAEEFSEKDS